MAGVFGGTRGGWGVGDATAGATALADGSFGGGNGRGGHELDKRARTAAVRLTRGVHYPQISRFDVPVYLFFSAVFYRSSLPPSSILLHWSGN